LSIFDLEKLAELVVARMGPLQVDHRRCTRARSPLSQCSRCVDICPPGALAFSEQGIEIADHCVECGLCAGVCPTEALQIQEPTELVLLDKIEASGAQGGAAAIGCRRQPQLNPRGWAVPCLGSLSRALLLVLDQSPFPVYLVMDEEKCAQCPAARGYQHCLGLLGEVRELLQTLGLKGGALRPVREAPPVKTAKPKASADPSRRAFFRSLLAGVKQVPAMVIQTVLEEPVQEAPAVQPIQPVEGVETGRLRLLKRGLQGRQDDKRAFGWLARPAVHSACYFCRACTVLCPVGAIKCSEDYRLTVDTGRCTGCGLCADICLYRSLVMVPGPIGNLFREEPVLLAQGVKGRCRSCGQEMIASEKIEICYICEKRASLSSAR